MITVDNQSLSKMSFHGVFTLQSICPNGIVIFHEDNILVPHEQLKNQGLPWKTKPVKAPLNHLP